MYKAISVYKNWLKPWYPIYIASMVYVITFNIWLICRHFLNPYSLPNDPFAIPMNATENDREAFCSYRFGYSAFNWPVSKQLNVNVYHVFWTKQALVFFYEIIALVCSNKIYGHLLKRRNVDKYFEVESDVDDCVDCRDFCCSLFDLCSCLFEFFFHILRCIASAPCRLHLKVKSWIHSR